MNMKNILIGISAFILSTSASAAIIDMGDYQYDDVSNLEWLDLTFTDSMSVQTAISTYASDGWIWATEGQFHAMYLNFDNTGLDGSVYGFSGSHSNNRANGVEVQNTGTLFTVANPHSISFMDMFGVTWESSYDLNQNGILDWYRRGTFGFYQSYTGTSAALGGVQSTVNQDQNTWRPDTVDNLYNYVATYTTGASSDMYGVFMVREATSVPEPSVVALFCAGLAGLGVARRKAKR